MTLIGTHEKRDKRKRDYPKHRHGRGGKSNALRIPQRLDVVETFSASGGKAGRARWELKCRGP